MRNVIETRVVRSARGIESTSDLDGLEGDLTIDLACEVGLDRIKPRDAMHERSSANEIGPLQEFHSRFLEFEPRGVERAALVRDQHDPLELVDLDEELQFIHDALLFEVRLRVPGEARGPAGKAEPVVAWKGKPVLEEVIEVFAQSPVGAVQRGGVHSR